MVAVRMSRKRLALFAVPALLLAGVGWFVLSVARLSGLVDGLGSSDPQVVARAIDRLSRMRSRRVIYRLVYAAANDKEQPGRRDAAKAALLAMGEAAAEPIVDAAVDRPPRWLFWIAKPDREQLHSRCIAASDILREIGRAAVEPVAKLIDDEDEEVRDFAAATLYPIDDPRVVEPLITYLRTIPNHPGFPAADVVRALGRQRDPRAVDVLIEVLSNKKGVPCCYPFREAAWALARIGDERAVEPLIAALDFQRGDESYSVHAAAARALGVMKCRAAVVPLTNLLGKGFFYERCAAAEALGDIGDESATGPLAAALEDADASVRVSAALALERMGTEKALGFLEESLAGADLGKFALEYDSYIAEGRESSVVPLVFALRRHGDLDMAKAFARAGKASLRTAADAWADQRNVGDQLGPVVRGGEGIWGKPAAAP